MSRLDDWLSARLARWVDGVRERAVPVTVACLAATLGFGVYAALGLRINSDNLALLSEDIPARRNHAAFAEIFPNLENALLVVVDAETPELARASAAALEKRLHAVPELFQQVYRPDGGEFFLRNGLLYRSVEELEEFSDQLVAMQPILAALERDPSIASLSKLVRRGLQAVRDGDTEAGAEQWPAVLDNVSQATVDVYTEFPVAISWEGMLLAGSALDVATRQLLVVHPTLDFGSPVAAARAVERVRTEARALELSPERGVRVRVTGNPALNYEEMLGIAWDIGVGGVFCFALVVVVLYFALGAWRLAAAAITTLLVGLVWAAAIAAALVGHLTVVSLSVAILFLGLGVDFAIHLGMRYAHALRAGRSHSEALHGAVEDVGSSLVLCTITTAIGFYVFVPTDYVGVAELGLIAGTSMIAMVFLTFTLFPALMSSWLALRGAPIERELRFESRLGLAVRRHAGFVRWLALALLLVGLASLPRARFDPNVVDMRDPGTESVQAFNDLLADTGQASPWYVDAVAPDAAAARELARRAEALEVVSHAITVADYVPADQEEKLEVLADLAFLLEEPVGGDPSAEVVPATEQVEALRELHAFLEEESFGETPALLDQSMRALRDHLAVFLERVDREDDPGPALARLEALLLTNFGRQIDRLRDALDASEVELASLPPELRARMLAADGRARVQIFPRHNLRSEAALREFTDAVATVAPQASGIAFNLIAFEEATKRSFVQGLVSAFVLIAALLYWLWRRVDDTLLVLAPLTLAAVLSVAAMALLDIPFNFVNVIVIPLMFGIGVDSGIHLVHRARELRPGEEVLGTTTARAVFYSALTTTISFGSLGLSSHVGMSGLGILLAVGMLLTVFCNLVVLPALLAWRSQPGQAGSGSP